MVLLQPDGVSDLPIGARPVQVADPPIGAVWVRGMEYIGNGTGALHGGHKVTTSQETFF